MRIPWMIALALAACDIEPSATDPEDSSTGSGDHTDAPPGDTDRSLDTDGSPHDTDAHLDTDTPFDTDAHLDTDPLDTDTDGPALSDCTTVGTVWCSTGCCPVTTVTLGGPTDTPHRRADLLAHPDGRILVSWYQTLDRELRLSRFDGVSWTTTVAHELPHHSNGFTHGHVYDQRLVLHAGDRPRIAFTGRSLAGTEVNPTPMGFVVTAFSAAATSWSIERVYTTTSTSGTLGAHRGPESHLVFHDPAASHVRTASFSGGVWNLDSTIQSQVYLGDGHTPDIALDSQGLRHVVWTQSGNPSRVIHVRHNGASWVRTVIGTADAIGFRPSVQVDADEYPHIAWYNGTAAELRYSWADDQGWHHEQVDPTGGAWPQLLFDANGAPWIVYKHVSSNQVRLARRTDAGDWVHAVVMVNLGTYDHPRFDLDAAGNPWVVAYDDYNARLRVAGLP